MKIDNEDALTIYSTVSRLWGDRIQKKGFYLIKGVYDYFLIYTNKRDDDFTVMGGPYPRKVAKEFGENEELSSESAEKLLNDW